VSCGPVWHAHKSSVRVVRKEQGGSTNEAPRSLGVIKAPRGVGCGEGVSPSPLEEGSGEGVAPSP